MRIRAFYTVLAVMLGILAQLPDAAVLRPVSVAEAGSPPFNTLLVQVDISSVLNADLVINDPVSGPIDPVNNAMDGENAFVSDAAVASLGGCSSPAGLPDSGFFPANVDHPAVKLTYSNEDNGLNARSSLGADTYNFSVPANNYTKAYVFFSSANLVSTANVTLTYATGPAVVAPVTVPDWFDDPAAAPTPSPTAMTAPTYRWRTAAKTRTPSRSSG